MASSEDGGGEAPQNPPGELPVSEAQEVSGDPEETGEVVKDEPPPSPPPQEAPAATAVELEESVNEEVVVAQAIESTVTEPETVVVDDPALETKSREIFRISPVVSAPSAADRASLWNCCGMLDVFSGSRQ